MLKGTVEDLYESYKKIESIVQEKNKEAKEQTKSENLSKLLSEGKIDDIEEVLVNSRVDNMYYNRFLQLTFTKLIFYIEAAKLGGEELDKDVLSFYEDNKQWLPDPIFTLDKGELVEAEKGILAKEREAFLNSEMFLRMKSDLESQAKRE